MSGWLWDNDTQCLRVDLRNAINPGQVSRVKEPKATRVLKRRHPRNKRANQSVCIQSSCVVVDGSQDSSVGNVWVFSHGEVSDKRSERESHDGELVGFAKCASVLAILDQLGELNEDGLLLAKLVGEARHPGY